VDRGEREREATRIDQGGVWSIHLKVLWLPVVLKVLLWLVALLSLQQVVWIGRQVELQVELLVHQALVQPARPVSAALLMLYSLFWLQALKNKNNIPLRAEQLHQRYTATSKSLYRLMVVTFQMVLLRKPSFECKVFLKLDLSWIFVRVKVP
jgi:hypothetical protein